MRIPYSACLEHGKEGRGSGAERKRGREGGRKRKSGREEEKKKGRDEERERRGDGREKKRKWNRGREEEKRTDQSHILDQVARDLSDNLAIIILMPHPLLHPYFRPHIGPPAITFTLILALPYVAADTGR